LRFVTQSLSGASLGIEVHMQKPISRRSLLSAIPFLPAAKLLRGQSPQAPPAQQEGSRATNFSTDVKVVNLFATVRTKQGKIVHDLTKDDFSLDDEGRQQPIKFFSQEANAPLYLGLLVDTSGSQRRVLTEERSASFKFFGQVLRPEKDLAFVLHFDYQVELLQDFTASRAKLERALDLLEVGDQRQQQQGQQGGSQGGNYPQGGGYPGGGYPGGGYPGGGYPGGGRRYPRGGGGNYPTGGGRRNGGTMLYDSILLASDDLMKKQEGRKALVLLTDGVDTGSKVTLYEAITAAQKSDTMVYSVLFADSDAYGNGGGLSVPGMGRRRPMGYPGGGGGANRPDGKKVLQQIAEETGGRFYQVSHFHPIDKIYADIEEDLRNQYSIGFTPDQPGEAGLYHHVHLTAKKKKEVLVVQARAGYYAT
jgi:VWFA-related protein